MIVVFVSNYLCHHQIDICNEFLVRPDVTFKFISSTKPAGQKATLVNFENMPFVIRPYESEKARREAIKWINDADICIAGSEDPNLLDKRTGPIFRYSENLNKYHYPFLHLASYLRFLKYRKLYKRESEKQNSYLLCSSYYTKRDFRSAGLYKNRYLKWGYFPKANIGLNLDNKSFSFDAKPLRIYYCAVSLKAFKRPSLAFDAVRRFKHNGLNVEATFVSQNHGCFKRALKNNIDLVESGIIKVISPLCVSENLKAMSNSHIYLFTSGYGEGFGAVCYEAMTSKCLVIASKAAGSTNLLIKDKINGLIFSSKSDLYKKIDYISKNLSSVPVLAQNAKEFVENHYNYKIAVANLIDFYKSGYSKAFEFGEPLSKL